MAFSTYKFVHLTILMLVFIVIPIVYVIWFGFAYFISCAAYAEYRFLMHARCYTSAQARDMGLHQRVSEKHKTVVLGLAIFQFLSSYFLLPSFSVKAAAA